VTRRRIYLHLMLIVLALLLVSCRRATGVQGPLIQATPTPTPRSTPLPPVATVVPPGTEGSPIRMVIRPPGSAVARSLITDFQVGRFEDALLEESGLAVDVTVVDRYAEALAALCDSTPTQVTVAWLDGVSYHAALAQNCGSPALQIVRGNRDGEVVQIVTHRQSAVSGVQGLRGSAFCRIGVDDYLTWLAPSLLMQGRGVNPVTGLGSVTDYTDVDALMEAVADRSCGAAAISEREFEALSSALRSELRVLDTTPPLPYGILMYPINLPLGERLRLADALVSLAAGAQAGEVVEPILGPGRLVPVQADTFASLTRFLDSTGLDFAQLGG
jgi:ABC-type phosphate/phosphonate transport system substrate-binding protein